MEDNSNINNNTGIQKSPNFNNVQLVSKKENSAKIFTFNNYQIHPEKKSLDIFSMYDEKTINKSIKLKKILDNKYFNYVLTFFTIFALFGDDFRILIFTKKLDDLFNILIILTMIFFSIEIIISIYALDDYFNSFFFWLDIISTITLILDLSWVSENFSSNSY